MKAIIVIINAESTRCPLCGSTEIGWNGPARECSDCGALFGEITRKEYEKIIPEGWSNDDPEKYFDFTLPSAKRIHGWLGKDGKIAQIG